MEIWSTAGARWLNRLTHSDIFGELFLSTMFSCLTHSYTHWERDTISTFDIVLLPQPRLDGNWRHGVGGKLIGPLQFLKVSPSSTVKD